MLWKREVCGRAGVEWWLSEEQRGVLLRDRPTCGEGSSRVPRGLRVAESLVKQGAAAERCSRMNLLLTDAKTSRAYEDTQSAWKPVKSYRNISHLSRHLYDPQRFVTRPRKRARKLAKTFKTVASKIFKLGACCL